MIDWLLHLLVVKGKTCSTRLAQTADKACEGEDISSTFAELCFNSSTHMFKYNFLASD